MNFPPRGLKESAAEVKPVNMIASGVQLGCGLGRGESATHLEAAATASEDRGSPRWCQLSTTHTKVRTYTGCPTNLNNTQATP